MRTISYFAALLVLPVLIPMIMSDSYAQEPPVAAERPFELEIHGDVRVDPYYWLRERENPDVIAYLEAENAWFEAKTVPMQSLQNELFDEIRARIPEADESVPYRVGEHVYFTRFEEGRQYPIYLRRSVEVDAPEEVLLNVNDLAEGSEFYSVSAGSSSISPNGRYFAWAADDTGRRFYTIRILDMQTGEMLDDVIPNVRANFVWANDNRTLFYARQDPETLRSHRIHRHTLGTDPAIDPLVYEETDDTYTVSVRKTRDSAYLMMVSSHTMASEWRILDAGTPEGDFSVFQQRERGHLYSIDHAGGDFYILSNRDAQNFRLMKTSAGSTAEQHWTEVIPHRDDVLLNGVAAFRDHLVVSEKRAGLPVLRVLPGADPERSYDIASDDPAYDISLGINPNFDTSTLRYVYQSPSMPTSTFEFDMTSRRRTLLKRDDVLGDFDPTNYRTERLYVPARDGARVPVTVVYRIDRFAQDGSNPLLLYGYGSYGFNIRPQFSSSRISLLDRGFVYAIAHIRGSETLGRHWYEDGKLLNKRNTFTDFIDVADFLVDDGYGDSDRMYAMGGSAGGLLMGAVMNMRPELFDGIIAHVPFVDVVTTMLDDTIPLTTGEYDEWGNPNEEPYYHYMLSYSPYDNVAAVEYPNLLVTTGLHDSQVQYWEPAKWVARLRHLKTDDNLLLMHTNMGAGHGGASGRFDRYQETARDFAFLIYLADIHLAHP